MKNTAAMIPYPLKSLFLGVAVFLSLVSVSYAAAAETGSVLDLRGKWKFELGDDEKRAKVAFDDSKWGEIFVPSSWEDEGYPGYDGYAWYRKHFRLPAGAEKRALYLRLGCIDDVSEVYLNGVRIGITGSFPPDFMTAYNTEIVLPVPQNALNITGDNVIAVRVYDDQLGGGIVQGKVGFYEAKDFLSPEISFAGNWQFKKGDSEQWIDPSFNDRSWDQIFVPGYWESQGYPRYDGVGWYRLHFRIPADRAQETLVLLLGKIDDLDETYVNGEEIGHTGRISSDPWRSSRSNEYQELRAYTIPGGLLKPGADNVIAVRVFDGGGPGGIYEGPVGIMTRDRYKEWRRHQPWRKDIKENPWRIFEKIFE
jgi:sialate O-acetylesterase